MPGKTNARNVSRAGSCPPLGPEGAVPRPQMSCLKKASEKVPAVPRGGIKRETVSHKMFRVKLGRARVHREPLSRHKDVAVRSKPIGPSHQVAKKFVASVRSAVIGIRSPKSPATGSNKAGRERVPRRHSRIDRCKHLNRNQGAVGVRPGKSGTPTVWLELKLSRRRMFSVMAHKFRHTRRAALP